MGQEVPGAAPDKLRAERIRTGSSRLIENECTVRGHRRRILATSDPSRGSSRASRSNTPPRCAGEFAQGPRVLGLRAIPLTAAIEIYRDRYGPWVAAALPTQSPRQLALNAACRDRPLPVGIAEAASSPQDR